MCGLTRIIRSILLCHPTVAIPFKVIFEKHFKGKEDQLYDELTTDVLEELILKCEDNAMNYDEYSLIVIDDSQSVFKHPEVAELMQELILKLRHLRCSIVLLCQRY